MSINNRFVLAYGKYVHYIYVFLLASIATYDVAFLNKFPKEDMIWNELAFVNSIRWFQDSSLVANLIATHDFRIGLGENVFSDFKSMPFIFSIVNWVNFSNVGISIYVEKFILVLIFCYGMMLLSRREAVIGISYYILTSSVVLMPLLGGEIGLLNQQFILITPLLIYQILRLCENCSARNVLFFVVLLCLFVGKSDIFVFFNIVTIYIYLLIVYAEFRRKILYIAAASFSIISFAYAYQIAGFIVPDEFRVTTRGSVDLYSIYDTFLRPVWKSIFIPTFIGPASFYLTPLFLAYVFLVIYRGDSSSRKFYACVSSLVIQISFTCILHIFFKNILPSSVRYNLTFPFVMAGICFASISTPSNSKEKTITVFALFLSIILTYLVNESKDSLVIPYKNYVEVYGKSVYDIVNIHITSSFVTGISIIILGIVFVFVDKFSKLQKSAIILMAPILVSIINNGQMLNWVDSGKFALRDSAYNTWIQSGVFECINQAIDIESESSKSFPRSFVTAATLFSSDYPFGQNDIAMAILEQPEKLNGRTFGQWRYNSSKALATINETYTGRAVTSWPLDAENPDAIKKYMLETESPYLLTFGTEVINENFVQIGSCKLDSTKTNLFKSINKTFEPLVNIYKHKGFNSNLLSAEYYSEYAKFTPNPSYKSDLYIFPIAFHPNLIALQDGIFLNLINSDKGLAAVKKIGNSPIYVTSYSKLRLALIISIILILTVTYLNRKYNFI